MGKPKPIQWRTQYDWDADAKERAATDILCEDESLTIQNAPDTDINELMKRFGISDGSTLPTSLGFPIGPEYYGDFSDVATLKDALDASRDIDAIFAELPANVRNKFDNDPYRLYEFVMDPKNAEEAVTLGLLTKARQEPNKADSDKPEPAPTGTSAPPTDTPK